jgi:hypothetical protein
MQDNHSWMGPSATRHWIGIINDDWRQIGFGDGMYWQPDPTSHRYVYGNAQNGDYTRLDAETGDLLDIRPRRMDGEPPYRWDWVSPSLISQHDPAGRESPVHIRRPRPHVGAYQGPDPSSRSRHPHAHGCKGG